MKNTTKKHLGLGLIFASLLTLAACGSSPKSESAPEATPAAPQAVTPTGPSDAEIAHIAVTANQIDIETGKAASKKSKDKKVIAFAKEMVKDHTAANKQATDLAKKLNVTPQDNDTSKSLMSAATDTAAKMKTLKGKEFDKAYIANEVTFHQTVLDALDNTLIPGAKNEELKSLLTKTRAVVAAHLEHAKNIQSSMK